MNHRKFNILLLILLFVSCIALSGCGNNLKMKDGYYTAETKAFDEHGWREYVCILVKDGVIISAEFNAKNNSGFIKAWDNNYMKQMGSIAGTYPNEYTRKYTEQLINKQSSETIDTVTGASISGYNFRNLTAAAIMRAQEGNSEVIQID